MHKTPLFILLPIILLIAWLLFAVAQKNEREAASNISFIVDGKSVKMYCKDDSNRSFGSTSRLKTWLSDRHQTLLFAMNGGMYKPDRSPAGLYVEDGKTLSPLDTTHENGNFYLLPNGVFYITRDKIAGISSTLKFNAINV